MRPRWDTGGPLALAFTRWAGDVSEFSPMQLANMQRAFYSGANLVIALIDAAKSNEEAAQLIAICKAESECIADVLNAANEPGTPAA